MPAPTTSRKRIVIRVLLIALALCVLAAAAYFGWQRFAYEMRTKELRTEFAKTATPVIAYVLPEGSGSRWYELRTYVDVVKHPLFDEGIITDIARTKQAYVIAQTADGYGVYRATEEGYEPLYASEVPLTSLAVSPDGESVAFAQAGAVPEVGVIVSGQSVSWLGAGFSPAFLSDTSVALLSGPAIRVHARESAAWDSGSVAYSASAPFSSRSALVSNGGKLAVSSGPGEAMVIDTANPDATPAPLTMHDLPVAGRAGASFVAMAPVPLGERGAIALSVEGQALENPIVIPFPESMPATIKVIE